MYDIRVYSSHSFSLVLDCVLPCSVSRGAANRPTNQSGFSPNRGSNPVTLIVLLSVLPALALKTYCCLPLLSSPIFFCPIRRARRTPPWRDRVTFRSSTGPTPLCTVTLSTDTSRPESKRQAQDIGHSRCVLDFVEFCIVIQDRRGPRIPPSLEVEVKLD